MITEIPTQSRSAGRVVATVLCIILAAAASAMILTAPVWSIDDQGLPAAAQPAAASSTAVTATVEPKPHTETH